MTNTVPDSVGKRVNPGFYEPPSKRIKTSNQMANIIQLDSFEFTSSNVVWLKQTYHDILFNNPEATNDQANYICIADKIYRVGINNLLPDFTIGLHQHQYSELYGSFTRNNEEECVWISPYLQGIAGGDRLSQVDFTIDLADRGCSIVMRWQELLQKIQRVLINTFSSYGQTFFLGLGSSKCTLQVDRAVKSTSNLSYGYIDAHTQINVSVHKSASLTLVDEVVNDASVKVKMSLRLLESGEQATPIIIQKKKLEDAIYEKYSKYEIPLGQTLEVSLDKGIMIEAVLDNAEINDTIYHSSTKKSSSKQTQKAFRFDLKPKINFYKNPDIIIVSTTTYPAGAIDAEISLATGKQLQWIEISKMTEYLRSVKDGVAKGQNLNISYNGTKVWLKVLRIHPKDTKYVKVNENGLDLWSIEPSTKIRFCAARYLKTPLVDHDQPKPLVEVKFNILPFTDSVSYPQIEVQEEQILETIREVVSRPLVKSQVIKLPVPNTTCKIKVAQLSFGLSDKAEFAFLGSLTKDTAIKIDNQAKNLIIQSKTSKDPVALLENYKMAGIPGEFKSFFRNLMIHQRLKEEVKMLEIPLEKGVLLAGPPGTGKSKLATAIAECLGCTKNNGRLISISGTEIYDKWVGGSEAKVRELFVPAIEAYDKDGDASEIYVVIIDEIDGLLAKRRGGVNLVDDKVVNEFLSCMDGPRPLKNLIAIGTTNRPELIDEAALRHGRFGKTITFSKPDLKGRQEIFEIYLEPLRKQNCLHKQVAVEKLAKETEGFSGCDIKGIVEGAKSKALERHAQTLKPLSVTVADLENLINEHKLDKLNSKVPQGMYS